MIVELLMLAFGVGLYLRVTRARDGVGRYALLSYVLLLLFAYVGDRFSDPPAEVDQIAWLGLIASTVMIPWAWWFERHRELRRV
jgi:hypothetical protein